MSAYGGVKRRVICYATSTGSERETSETFGDAEMASSPKGRVLEGPLVCGRCRNSGSLLAPGYLR